MNIFSLVIAGLFGLLIIAFKGLPIFAIVFNLKVGKKYRQSLAGEVERLRLGKMLSALGIDVLTKLTISNEFLLYSDIAPLSISTTIR